MHNLQSVKIHSEFTLVAIFDNKPLLFIALRIFHKLERENP
jgi:hypothetical protein